MRMLLLCLFLLLTGCASGGETDPRPVPAAWSADVEAISGTGPTGFATVTVLSDGGTRANLTLAGASEGDRHSWRIRRGSCPSDGAGPGAEVGSTARYPRLEAGPRGNASGTATLDERLERDGEYSVVVYRSERDDQILACGELRPTI